MTEKNTFQSAIDGQMTKTPVWFMRQAGRCLPEYRAIRERYQFREMMAQPDIATEVTLLPIQLLGVDAAILFADILTLPMAMGFDIDFVKGKGPIVANPIRCRDDLALMRDYDDLSHVTKTIQNLCTELPAHVPLIGFAGTPLTVGTYLIEGGSSKNFSKCHRLMQQDPETFHTLMRHLTQQTIRYAKMQQDAGVQAFQLFDSWGAILGETAYRSFALPYVQQIFESVTVPSIFYLRGASHLLPILAECGADFVSLDEHIPVDAPAIVAMGKGVQGNLFNGTLYADNATIDASVDAILRRSRAHKRFIFNLGHGLFPDTPVDAVKRVIDRVHADVR